MKRNFITLYVLIVIALLIAAALVLNAGGGIKEPFVAGGFYPADKTALGKVTADFLARADTPTVEGQLIALIAPHAGYEYSGAVAAYAYKHLTERNIDTVILMGPSHHSPFTGVAVYTTGGMRTPLGTIKINSSIAKALLDEKSQVASYPAAFDKEHSLEVQLPFLQSALKKFTIVPILIGRPTRESFVSLTRSLTAILKKNQNVLIVASTDFSHYHDYALAGAMDHKAIDAVARMSVEDLQQRLSKRECEMCGEYAVLFAMAVARNLGATHGVLYKYANSGDVTNDKTRVVGYAAMGLYKSRLTDGERKELLALAQKTIDFRVRRGATPEHTVKNPRLMANGAAFVTINRKGTLRGCIGTIQPVMPLYRAVITNAVSACSRDPRFPPMTKEELRDMEVQVTVLSSLEPLDDIKNIQIGIHGLYIVKGINSGVLLPQVAQEYNWDVRTFLEQVAIKAGLPKEAWKDAELYSFTADIIK